MSEPVSDAEIRDLGDRLAGLVASVRPPNGHRVVRCRDCAHLHTTMRRTCPECGSGDRVASSMGALHG